MRWTAGKRVAAGHLDLAHVADVEQPGARCARPGARRRCPSTPPACPSRQTAPSGRRARRGVRAERFSSLPERRAVPWRDAGEMRPASRAGGLWLSRPGRARDKPFNGTMRIENGSRRRGSAEDCCCARALGARDGRTRGASAGRRERLARRRIRFELRVGCDANVDRAPLAREWQGRHRTRGPRRLAVMPTAKADASDAPKDAAAYRRLPNP